MDLATWSALIIVVLCIAVTVFICAAGGTRRSPLERIIDRNGIMWLWLFIIMRIPARQPNNNINHNFAFIEHRLFEAPCMVSLGCDCTFHLVRTPFHAFKAVAAEAMQD